MNLIIGGSSGLGNSLAQKFSKSSKTIIVSRKEPKNIKDNILHLSFDINSDSSNQIYQKIKENELTNIFFTVGLIDWENDDFSLSQDKFEKILETNFISVRKIIFNLVKEKKLSSNCLICFCSSVSTILPRQRQMAYCSAKSALNAFCKSLRAYFHYNKLNYRVANLILGYMDTEMNKNISLPFKKENPDKIANYLFEKQNKLNGTYYLPKYWILIKAIIDFIPEKILVKIIKLLNL